MTRPSKDEYYMMIAVATSLRSPCVRRKVGAVIVNNDRIISTGYNGGVRGFNNCLGEEACKGGGSGCQTTIHAEANAIIHANRDDMVGSTLYVTTNPCQSCQKIVANSGIVLVKYLSKYRETDHLGKFGLKYEQTEISSSVAADCYELSHGWDHFNASRISNEMTDGQVDLLSVIRSTFPLPTSETELYAGMKKLGYGDNVVILNKIWNELVALKLVAPGPRTLSNEFTAVQTELGRRITL